MSSIVVGVVTSFMSGLLVQLFYPALIIAARLNPNPFENQASLVFYMIIGAGFVLGALAEKN